jgi:hypothetical protein
MTPHTQSFTRQKLHNLATSQEGMGRVEFIETVLDLDLSLICLTWLIVKAGTGEAQQLCLLSQGQLPLPFDHLLAFRACPGRDQIFFSTSSPEG